TYPCSCCLFSRYMPFPPGTSLRADTAYFTLSMRFLPFFHGSHSWKRQFYDNWTMADENHWIEVHLAGADLLPSKINARDVGKLITAVEAMIAALVVRENPTLGLSEAIEGATTLYGTVIRVGAAKNRHAPKYASWTAQN
ncbi:MAG: hypothetical protein ACYDBJ_05635, partial [Aggregatilineales bacterium]